MCGVLFAHQVECSYRRREHHAPWAIEVHAVRQLDELVQLREVYQRRADRSARRRHHSRNDHSRHLKITGCHCTTKIYFAWIPQRLDLGLAEKYVKTCRRCQQLERPRHPVLNDFPTSEQIDLIVGGAGDLELHRASPEQIIGYWNEETRIQDHMVSKDQQEPPDYHQEVECPVMDVISNLYESYRTSLRISHNSRDDRGFDATIDAVQETLSRLKPHVYGKIENRLRSLLEKYDRLPQSEISLSDDLESSAAAGTETAIGATSCAESGVTSAAVSQSYFTSEPLDSEMSVYSEDDYARYGS